jgi:hypothetical protein
MISRKEFIKQCEEKFGFPSTEWKSIKRFIPPHGAQIRSLGKDGKGGLFGGIVFILEMSAHWLTVA